MGVKFSIHLNVELKITKRAHSNLQIAIEVGMGSRASTVHIEDGTILNERDACILKRFTGLSKPHSFHGRLKWSGTLNLYSTKSTWNYTNTSNRHYGVPLKELASMNTFYITMPIALLYMTLHYVRSCNRPMKQCTMAIHSEKDNINGIVLQA